MQLVHLLDKKFLEAKFFRAGMFRYVFSILCFSSLYLARVVVARSRAINMEVYNLFIIIFLINDVNEFIFTIMSYFKHEKLLASVIKVN